MYVRLGTGRREASTHTHPHTTTTTPLHVIRYGEAGGERLMFIKCADDDLFVDIEVSPEGIYKVII